MSMDIVTEEELEDYFLDELDRIRDIFLSNLNFKSNSDPETYLEDAIEEEEEFGNETENIDIPNNLYFDFETYSMMSQIPDFNELIQSDFKVPIKDDSNKFIDVQLVEIKLGYPLRSIIKVETKDDVLRMFKYMIPWSSKRLFYILSDGFSFFKKILKQKYKKSRNKNKLQHCLDSKKRIYSDNKTLSMYLIELPENVEQKLFKEVVECLNCHNCNSKLFIKEVMPWHKRDYTSLSKIPQFKQTTLIVSLILKHISSHNLKTWNIFNLIELKLAFLDLRNFGHNIDLEIERSFNILNENKQIFKEFDLTLYLKKTNQKEVHLDYLLYFLWLYGTELETLHANPWNVKGMDMFSLKKIMHSNADRNIKLHMPGVNYFDWSFTSNQQLWSVINNLPLNTTPALYGDLLDLSGIRDMNGDTILKILSIMPIRKFKFNIEHILYIDWQIFACRQKHISKIILHNDIFEINYLLDPWHSNYIFSKIYRFFKNIYNNTSNRCTQIILSYSSLELNNIYLNWDDLENIERISSEYETISFTYWRDSNDEKLQKILDSQNNLKKLHVLNSFISECFLFMYAEKQITKNKQSTFSFESSRPLMWFSQTTVPADILHKNWAYVFILLDGKIVLKLGNKIITDLYMYQNSIEEEQRGTYEFYQ